MNRSERREIYRRDIEITINSPEDSDARRHLRHIQGAALGAIVGLGELITGVINRSEKNVFLGAFIYLVTSRIANFRINALHKAVQELKQ